NRSKTQPKLSGELGDGLIVIIVRLDHSISTVQWTASSWLGLITGGQVLIMVMVGCVCEIRTHHSMRCVVRHRPRHQPSSHGWGARANEREATTREMAAHS